MGHDVEQRLVKVGEDLSMYDRVICFLASPRQALQLTFYNGLWTIYNTPKDKLILAFDDWQTDGIFKGILSCTDHESLLKEFTINQSQTDKGISREILEPYADRLLEAVNYIASKQAPILLSVFAGGDMTKLIEYDKDKLFGYNPNPYHRNRVPGDRGDLPLSKLDFMEAQLVPTVAEDTITSHFKDTCFNFASLVQGRTAKWLKKQNIQKWKIEYFGSRKEKQRRLSEEDMCLVYGEQWGCLMPGYDHAGSGWWRARPLQVTDAGSILIGEREEMDVLFDCKKAAEVKAGDLENLTLEELEEIATLQKNSIYRKHPLDKSVQQDELKKALSI